MQPSSAAQLGAAGGPVLKCRRHVHRESLEQRRCGYLAACEQAVLRVLVTARRKYGDRGVFRIHDPVLRDACGGIVGSFLLVVAGRIVEADDPTAKSAPSQ